MADDPLRQDIATSRAHMYRKPGGSRGQSPKEPRGSESPQTAEGVKNTTGKNENPLSDREGTGSELKMDYIY